jgi:hypothetical protein
MRRFLASLVFTSAVAFAASPVVFASTDIEVTIDQEVIEINEDASTPYGEVAVIGKIEKEFNVDKSVITGLRGQKLGYGEISIALSLAERLPGGITAENIDKIISMRQGPPVTGWGNVARDLDLRLKPAAGHLEKVSAEAKKEIVKHERATKLEKAAKLERVEKAQRPERVEKIERIEKVERIERIERPERPERSARK